MVQAILDSGHLEARIKKDLLLKNYKHKFGIITVFKELIATRIHRDTQTLYIYTHVIYMYPHI